MEHYIKIKEECVEPFNGNTSLVEAISVTGDSKFYQVVRTACKCLKNNMQVLLLGEGSSAQKVISISEKIKETCSLNITECIEIFETEYKDLWVPNIDNMGLGNLEVTRAVPTTKILLKQEESESSDSHDKKHAHHRTAKQHTVKSTNGNKHSGSKSKSKLTHHENGSIRSPCKKSSNEDRVLSSVNGDNLKEHERRIPNKKHNYNKGNGNTREKSQKSEKPSNPTNNNDVNFIKQTPPSDSESYTVRTTHKDIRKPKQYPRGTDNLQTHRTESQSQQRNDCNNRIAKDDEK